MNFEDLPQTWRSTDQPALTTEELDAIVARIANQVKQLNRDLIRRDILETAAALFVVVFFGAQILLAKEQSVMAVIGSSCLILFGLLVVFKLFRARARHSPAPPDAPIREYIRVELGRIDAQIQLLQSVAWWYIAPFVVGTNLFFVGVAGLSIASLVYFIVTLLIARYVYSLNVTAAKKELEPQRNILADLLRDLGGGAEAVVANADLLQ